MNYGILSEKNWLTSKRDQPPNNGQNAWSQVVLYSEVPLYFHSALTAIIIIYELAPPFFVLARERFAAIYILYIYSPLFSELTSE